ncbi:hypothetical protein BASA50_007976 [Batrachochytrium salamandrivorans]|uniref:BRCT domain-containing protein n=1 Tax=Batrachochytrium salamandrivorans TaxID=1357716 RepID=A0ABQ8F8Q8_9FUNG|nr:hypothetical protein BASA50_007976 [Batrachochytrium salamandrivorans]
MHVLHATNKDCQDNLRRDGDEASNSSNVFAGLVFSVSDSLPALARTQIKNVIECHGGQILLSTSNHGVELQSSARGAARKSINMHTPSSSVISLQEHYPKGTMIISNQYRPDLASQGIRQVTPLWVEKVVLHNRFCGPEFYSPNPEKFCTGIVAYCDEQIPSGDVEILYGGIEAFGGQWRTSLTDDTTHVIALSDSTKTTKAALAMPSVKIILPHYFDDCFTLRRYCSDDAYLFPEPKLFSKHSNNPIVSKFTRQGSAETIDVEQRNPKMGLDDSFLHGHYIFFDPSLRKNADCVKLVESLKTTRAKICISYEPARTTIAIMDLQSRPAFKQALSDAVLVGTPQWLGSVLAEKRLSNPKLAALHFPRPSIPIKGAETMVISVSNYVGAAREDIATMCAHIGAQFTRFIRLGVKYLRALEWNINIVNHLWIEETYVKWVMQREAKPRYTRLTPSLGSMVNQIPVEYSLPLLNLKEDQETPLLITKDSTICLITPEIVDVLPCHVPASGALDTTPTKSSSRIRDRPLTILETPSQVDKSQRLSNMTRHILSPTNLAQEGRQSSACTTDKLISSNVAALRGAHTDSKSMAAISPLFFGPSKDDKLSAAQSLLFVANREKPIETRRKARQKNVNNISKVLFTSPRSTRLTSPAQQLPSVKDRGKLSSSSDQETKKYLIFSDKFKPPQQYASPSLLAVGSPDIFGSLTRQAMTQSTNSDKPETTDDSILLPGLDVLEASTRNVKKDTINLESIPNAQSIPRMKSSIPPSNKRLAETCRPNPTTKTESAHKRNRVQSHPIPSPTAKPTITFTTTMSSISQQHKKLMKRLGAVFINHSDVTCLVASKIVRTTKFLLAITQGRPIVHPGWILACLSANTLLPLSDYTLVDKQGEARYDMTLLKSIESGKSAGLLEGVTVVFTWHVQEIVARDVIELLVNVAGGNAVLMDHETMRESDLRKIKHMCNTDANAKKVVIVYRHDETTDGFQTEFKNYLHTPILFTEDDFMNCFLRQALD